MQEVCKSWRSGFQNSITKIRAKVPVPHLAAIPDISRFGGLQALELSGDVSELSLLGLRESSVRTLDLAGCRGDVPRFMSTFKGASLTCITLQGPPSLTDVHIEALEGFPLKKLCLGRFTHEGDSWSRKTEYAQLTGQGIDLFKGFSQLTDLTLGGFSPRLISPSNFSALQGLPLTTLKLATVKENLWERVPNDEIHGPVPGLYFNSLLEELRGLPLTDLVVADGFHEVSDNGLSALKDLPLTSLRLEGCGKISDEGLLCLRGKPLTSLTLWVPWLFRSDMNTSLFEFTRAGFGVLKGMPLKDLSIHGDMVFEDADFEALRGLPLERLVLKWQMRGDHRITDQGLVFLNGLPLTHLELFGNLNLTDAGLAALQDFRLAHVEISGKECPFTDRGLMHFCNMRSLTSLVLEGGNNHITEQGSDALKSLMPNLSRLLVFHSRDYFR